MQRLMAVSFLLCTLIAVLTEFTVFPQEVLHPPENVTFQWKNNEIVVYITKPAMKLQARCFQLVLQFRSNIAMDWQKPITSKNCDYIMPSFYCNFANPNLNPEKCYLIQLKLKAQDMCVEEKESTLGPVLYFMNGTTVDSCSDHTVHEEAIPNILIIIVSTTILLAFFVTVLLTCIMKRFKRYVIPTIPDPKHTFHGLFEEYNGNFQEWILSFGNEAKQLQNEHLDKECIIEEQLIEEKDMQRQDDDLLNNLHVEREEMKRFLNISESFVENGTAICTGNITFTMNDSQYVIL